VIIGAGSKLRIYDKNLVLLKKIRLKNGVNKILYSDNNQGELICGEASGCIDIINLISL
jgi:hypothetical protein